MKLGKTLDELRDEVVRRANAKRDFIADTRMITFGLTGNELDMHLGGEHHFKINDLAHRQIGQHVKMPADYYDRCRNEAPTLLGENIRTWFQKYPSKQMIRTLDGVDRAFLSDHYRSLDDIDLWDACVPPLIDAGAVPLSMDVTDKRLYIKVADQRITRDLKGKVLGRGHEHFNTVSPAFCLSNSEVGYGALSAQFSVLFGGCTNLMVLDERSVRKYHLGSKHDIGDQVYALLSDTTKKLTDASLWATIRDVAKAAFDEKMFEGVVEKLNEATEDKIERPMEVIEITAKKYGLTEPEKAAVTRHFIEGGELNRFGLQAAITRTAEDLPSYDRASEFERLGGKIIELPKNEWKSTLDQAMKIAA
jgi:hypothetical protein